MKKILFIWFVSIGLMTSCVENPEEDPDPVPAVGNLQADFDGSRFNSVTTSVVLNNESLTIKGTDETGAFFNIFIPEAPIVGTYTLDEVPGLVLEYHENDGSSPYIAANDDIGPFASFSSYIDTAQLVITAIDRTNKRLYGSFRFTGVRFSNDAQTTIETKVFTDGAFFSLPYTSTAVVDPTETILLRRIVNTYPGAGIADQTAVYNYNGNKIVSEIYTDSQGLQTTTTYNYDGDNIALIEEREEGELVYRETFQYNTSNKLETYIAVDFWEDTSIKETYVHNPDGSIDVTRLIGDLDTQTEDDGTSKIYFVSGEVDRITFSSGNTITYTYDNKNNPFKNVLGFNKIAFVDGEARGISKNILQTTGSTPDFDFTYTYNTDNYPLTSTLPEVVSTFFYE